MCQFGYVRVRQYSKLGGKFGRNFEFSGGSLAVGALFIFTTAFCVYFADLEVTTGGIAHARVTPAKSISRHSR